MSMMRSGMFASTKNEEIANLLKSTFKLLDQNTLTINEKENFIHIQFSEHYHQIIGQAPTTAGKFFYALGLVDEEWLHEHSSNFIIKFDKSKSDEVINGLKLLAIPEGPAPSKLVALC